MDTQLIPINTSTVPNLDVVLDNYPYLKSQRSRSKVYTGTVVINFTGDCMSLFTDAQYKSIVGRSFDLSTDCILFMNGDWYANGWWGFCAAYLQDRKEIYVMATMYGITNATIKGAARLNYTIIAG